MAVWKTLFQCGSSELGHPSSRGPVQARDKGGLQAGLEAPELHTEGSSSASLPLCTRFGSCRKRVPRELPALAWDQERVSRELGQGAVVPVSADSGSSPGPYLLLQPTQPPSLPPCSLCTSVPSLHGLWLQTDTPSPSSFSPTSAAASRPVAIEPTCMSINSS